MCCCLREASARQCRDECRGAGTCPELLRAFQASKELHLQRLAAAGPATADDRLILENQELIGGADPLPCGLAANRPTIEALIQYAYSQKIIPAPLRPEEVFAPNALDL
jgi:4,5-dihydroxyphthalate decarboxylase